jgi:hypothetical protein
MHAYVTSCLERLLRPQAHRAVDFSKPYIDICKHLGLGPKHVVARPLHLLPGESLGQAVGHVVEGVDLVQTVEVGALDAGVQASEASKPARRKGSVWFNAIFKASKELEDNCVAKKVCEVTASQKGKEAAVLSLALDLPESPLNSGFVHGHCMLGSPQRELHISLG